MKKLISLVLAIAILLCIAPLDDQINAVDVQTNTDLEIIIREGNFGHETAYQRVAGYGFISGKLHSLRFNIRRISKVAKIFPREMASRFYYMLVSGTARAFKEFFARFA